MAVTLEVGVYDTNGTTRALTGDQTKLIRYHSHAYCEITSVTSAYPVDNDLLIIRNGDETRYGWNGTFENVESNVFTFSAEDSEGNIGTATYKADMIPYVKLTCNMVNNRPDATGNMTIQCYGNYFSGNFGALNNDLSVQCRYQKPDGSYSDWMTMTTAVTYNYYTAICAFTIPNFNHDSAYVFECVAWDRLNRVSATPITARSTPVFHWGESSFQFEVPVTVNGNISVLGDANVSGDLRIGGTPIPVAEEGTWTPRLSSSAVSYYTSQYGWYSKVGQTVCVGFHIKANCNSGYHNTNISISGLPFTPMVATAGGGMCSGAYMSSAGLNFQCFVAETGGNITARVQACDRTESANLNTSASGCRYRYDGGEVTLSGTITYMTNE